MDGVWANPVPCYISLSLDAKSTMSEFVILFHKMPDDASRADHWDLMLEMEQSLVVWALNSVPQAGEVIQATRLPDHRLAYLEIQGPISGGGGTVTRVAKGNCRWIEVAEQRWVARLEGHDFCWQVTIVDSAKSSATVEIQSCFGDGSVAVEE